MCGTDSKIGNAQGVNHDLTHEICLVATMNNMTPLWKLCEALIFL